MLVRTWLQTYFVLWDEEIYFLFSSSVTYWKTKTWFNYSFNVLSLFRKSKRKTIWCWLSTTGHGVEPNVGNGSSVPSAHQGSRVGILFFSLLAAWIFVCFIVLIQYLLKLSPFFFFFKTTVTCQRKPKREVVLTHCSPSRRKGVKTKQNKTKMGQNFGILLMVCVCERVSKKVPGRLGRK